MTISLEQLADGSASDRNFQKLMSLVPDTGGQSVGVRFGTGTYAFANGAALSGANTVTHGLGRTPVVVLVLVNGTGGPDLVVCQAFTIGATTFQTQGGFRTGTAAGATNVTFGWVAVG